MRADEEREFREFVTARLQPLKRSAYLLCGDQHIADDLVAIAVGKQLPSTQLPRFPVAVLVAAATDPRLQALVPASATPR